jgi:hypothetical protein
MGKIWVQVAVEFPAGLVAVVGRKPSFKKKRQI